MRIRHYYVYVIISLLMTISFTTGCKKSSSDNSNPVGPVNPGTTNPLLGTWVLTKITITNPDNTTQTATPAQVGFDMSWTFNNDNTYQFLIMQQGGNSTQSGTYTYVNNVITLKDQNNAVKEYNLQLKGTALTMPITLEQNGTQFPTMLEFSKK